jgi:methylenetetrahydrofolate dehydrogenase (NADP+)/methenyltetrahydrofolate cyclohydrolase
LDTQAVLDAIRPEKDVDCFHPDNVGRLVQQRPRFLPCTPHGVLQVLRAYRLTTAGKHVVIVGRSEIVGKPLAALLVQKHGPLGADYANATVTCCHSQTVDLTSHLRRAEIVVAAVGQPRFIHGSQLQPGAIVIDVGINRTAAGLVGDVDFPSCAQVAQAITPVPGGIGPLTVAMLLENTLRAARLSASDPYITAK